MRWPQVQSLPHVADQETSKKARRTRANKPQNQYLSEIRPAIAPPFADLVSGFSDLKA